MIKLCQEMAELSHFRRCVTLKKKDLKSFDIASYDIEIEYNSKIAPITKKIAKLNKNHKIKSLKSHKDFLAKEKQAKEKLKVLAEKAVLRDQRIEKAVENKLVKLRNKDQKLKREFSLFKSTETELFSLKFGEIDRIISELKASENRDIETVQKKYQENVTSYVEKLDTYNNNFENNRKIHSNQIKEYSELLNSKFAEIDDLKTALDSEISSKLEKYIAEKNEENEQKLANINDTEQILNNGIQKIKQNSNIKVKSIKSDLEKIQIEYKERFKVYIEHIEEAIIDMNQKFEERKELIEEDLRINLDKLNLSVEEPEESLSKNAKKTIKMKIDLFNLRASTTQKYEEDILKEKVHLLQQEIESLRFTLNNELVNLSKLEVFLLHDQIEIKDTGDYFKGLNITTKKELNNFEFSNNEYLVRHEHLKTEFIRKYTDLFDAFKHSLLALNKSSIDQLTVINQEIDEINKYLDLSEPLKEIEVNKLRENIEVTEIKERYNIKYAKQAHERKILNNELDTIIAIEETEVKSLISENNKDITNVKNKETLDKAIEKAKLKHNKATEIYKLRLNNTRLEGNILRSNFETEIDVYDFEKEIIRHEVQKNNILISKEIKSDINNIETEAKYKIEVINKRLEEELIKLDEHVSRLVYEQDAFSANVDLAISKERLDHDKKTNTIMDEIQVKFSRIDTALEREIKEPTISIAKADSIINDRLAKLELNNAIFSDFISDSTEVLFDDNLTINQIKALAANNLLIYEKSAKYIGKSYDSLKEAISFMNELEKRSALNRISSTTDQGLIKKLNKQLKKKDIENKKKFISIDSSIKEKNQAIKNQLKSNLTKLSKQKTDNIENLRAMVIDVYQICFESLKALQENVLSEVINVYKPLTASDKEIIENAETNALKAKKLVEIEKQDRLKPLEEELKSFTEKFENQRKENFEKLEIQVKELKENIKNLKQTSLDKVTEITKERDELVISQKEQLRVIEETEEAEIVKQLEAIDARKSDLEKAYNNTLRKLQNKDDEAKKIYEYEQRIFTIARETATSRFNDSNVKTENANFLNISSNNQLIETLKKDSEKLLRVMNQNLLDLTKKFEKIIFTTRPRMEELIGDAQKAIESEITLKEKRLSYLTDRHSKITQSLENNLYTSFQDGYEKLIRNLNYYLEKYKVIGDDYKSSITTSNVVISESNIAFANALFELANKKHKEMREKLLEINTHIT